MSVEECKLIELPVTEDRQGDLAFAEGERHVPFPIARVFFVYGVPGSAIRGGHCHRALEQALFCVAGRMDVTLDDGTRRRTITLEDPHIGLYLPPMVWFDFDNFSPGTVYLVLTSEPFDESDYIRDYNAYLAAVGVSSTASATSSQESASS